MKIKELYNILDSIAPFDSAEEWDNSGLIIGKKSDTVSKIGIVLDIDRTAAEYAKKNGIDLIISHHPVIFDKEKEITPDSTVAYLRKNNIASIAMHTNMDRTGLINKALAEKLGLTYIEDIAFGYGIVCRPEHEMTTPDFAGFIKQKAGASGIIYYGHNNINKVAVSSGSAFDDCDRALMQGCDGIITSDVKHNCFVEAKDKNISVFSVDHFDTENIFCKVFYNILKERLTEKTELEIINQEPFCIHI